MVKCFFAASALALSASASAYTVASPQIVYGGTLPYLSSTPIFTINGGSGTSRIFIFNFHPGDAPLTLFGDSSEYFADGGDSTYDFQRSYNGKSLLVQAPALGGDLATYASYFKISVIEGGVAGRLYTVAVQNSIPEPATWALMLLGVGLTGAALRKRKETTSALTA